MKNIDVTDLIVNANDLQGALQGLESFVWDKFTTIEIKREDLSALQGLVRAIEIMATKHAEDMEQLEFEN